MDSMTMIGFGEVFAAEPQARAFAQLRRDVSELVHAGRAFDQNPGDRDAQARLRRALVPFHRLPPEMPR